ncbi:hypothetical protein FHS18_006087 [Paenibacillus phyllosphaerae]|uniref:SLH domain-containing protein n=1 Tax=Paenibacillus phyllosphaerae TaxID=274593 RepID=A0A7W5B4W3_9BACL|nr:S-layer homology domain-containing protein [Paenibacillus phyllosphaerae]MBB3113971.1 hypothetical protein [Paenibacillus phyllosphaerae]
MPVFFVLHVVLHVVSIADVQTLAQFKDAGSISGYAKEAASLLADEGVMQGDGNHNFAPKAPANRTQAAVVLSKLLKVS